MSIADFVPSAEEASGLPPPLTVVIESYNSGLSLIGLTLTDSACSIPHSGDDPDDFDNANVVLNLHDSTHHSRICQGKLDALSRVSRHALVIKAHRELTLQRWRRNGLLSTWRMSPTIPKFPRWISSLEVA